VLVSRRRSRWRSQSRHARAACRCGVRSRLVRPSRKCVGNRLAGGPSAVPRFRCFCGHYGGRAPISPSPAAGSRLPVQDRPREHPSRGPHLTDRSPTARWGVRLGVMRRARGAMRRARGRITRHSTISRGRVLRSACQGRLNDHSARDRYRVSRNSGSGRSGDARSPSRFGRSRPARRWPARACR